MTTLLRVVHLLALGLWFGSVTFFSFFTALPIIDAMQAHATGRDYWMPLTEKTEGTRLAGDALEPVFKRYFPVQVICGAAALLTFRWWGDASIGRRRVRLGVLVLAFALACVNTFYLSRQVHAFRTERYVKDQVSANRAKDAFDRWHGFSLWTDMAGLACVTAALALAAAGKRDGST